MAHFYDCSNVLEPTFLPDVATPAQARKVHRAYPSVTTVLGIVKDAFIDSIYKPRMITEIARDKPDLAWQDVERLTYGTREHPITGDIITSSEFGTTVHKVIEDLVSHRFGWTDTEPEDTVWSEWAIPFIQWVYDNNVSPIACERIVANNRIKIAGSVDFIGHNGEGKLFLADYKCRSNTGGKAKTYPKDCQQLAIESYMLMKEHKLPYLPGCRSVVIDCDTKEHHHKEWSQEEMEKGIKVAKKCAELYWLLRMQ